VEDDVLNPSENLDETPQADDLSAPGTSPQELSETYQEPLAPDRPSEGDAEEEAPDQPSAAQPETAGLPQEQPVAEQGEAAQVGESTDETSGDVAVARTEPQPRQRLSKDEKLDLLVDVPLTVTAELGRTVLSIADILNLDHGSVIELDRAPADPVDLLVNGQIVANGEVVVVDDKFGIRIVNIVNSAEGGNKSAPSRD